MKIGIKIINNLKIFQIFAKEKGFALALPLSILLNSFDIGEVDIYWSGSTEEDCFNAACACGLID